MELSKLYDAQIRVKCEDEYERYMNYVSAHEHRNIHLLAQSIMSRSISPDKPCVSSKILDLAKLRPKISSSNAASFFSFFMTESGVDDYMEWVREKPCAERYMPAFLSPFFADWIGKELDKLRRKAITITLKKTPYHIFRLIKEFPDAYLKGFILPATANPHLFSIIRPYASISETEISELISQAINIKIPESTNNVITREEERECPEISCCTFFTDKQCRELGIEGECRLNMFYIAGREMSRDIEREATISSQPYVLPLRSILRKIKIMPIMHTDAGLEESMSFLYSMSLISNADIDREFDMLRKTTKHVNRLNLNFSSAVKMTKNRVSKDVALKMLEMRDSVVRKVRRDNFTPSFAQETATMDKYETDAPLHTTIREDWVEELLKSEGLHTDTNIIERHAQIIKEIIDIPYSRPEMDEELTMAVDAYVKDAKVNGMFISADISTPLICALSAMCISPNYLKTCVFLTEGQTSHQVKQLLMGVTLATAESGFKFVPHYYAKRARTIKRKHASKGLDILPELIEGMRSYVVRADEKETVLSYMDNDVVNVVIGEEGEPIFFSPLTINEEVRKVYKTKTIIGLDYHSAMTSKLSSFFSPIKHVTITRNPPHTAFE